MKKTVYILRRINNATVTSHNFDIINEAAINTGMEVVDYASMRICKKYGLKNDVYVVTTCEDALSLFFSGRKKIFFWIQGIIPEESFMRHHSRLRFTLLSVIEKLSLKFSAYTACVSQAMINHYEQKYGLQIQDKSYVFPCFNAVLNEEAFLKESKYSENVFTYAGGLAEWQCFGETLDIYKKIEDFNIPGTKLQVLTKDKATAEKEIIKRGIRNYEIGFYPKEDLPKVMSKSKFGFVIRKPDPVNEVSTPTKISTYLSCGLIPIFGDSVKSFREQSADLKYAVAWDIERGSYDGVVSLMKSEIKNSDVLEEYKKVFNRYYSDTNHRESIKDILIELAR